MWRVKRNVHPVSLGTPHPPRGSGRDTGEGPPRMGRCCYFFRSDKVHSGSIVKTGLSGFRW